MYATRSGKPFTGSGVRTSDVGPSSSSRSIQEAMVASVTKTRSGVSAATVSGPCRDLRTGRTYWSLTGKTLRNPHRPLRLVLGLVLQYQSDRPLPDPR